MFCRVLNMLALIYSKHRTLISLRVVFLTKTFTISGKFHCFLHCVKSVRIRSLSGPYFPAFRLNTERQYHSVFSPNAGRYGPEKLQIQAIFTQCQQNVMTRFFEGSLDPLIDITLQQIHSSLCQLLVICFISGRVYASAI